MLAAAFNAILADDRPINVRPWLYRIARNRSLNHLRRMQAVGVDSMDVHLSDNGASTADKVHEREEFRVLVDDIHELPETQRTALVLREMDALSYEQIAEAMETTVSSVKSLLVRARVSLAEAAEARLLSCDEVRIELGEVAEGLRRRPSSLVRRHLRSCKRCSSFKVQLRETNKALTALLPIGPLVLLRKLALVHLGHSAAGGSSATGAGAAGAGAAGQAAAVGTTTAAAGAAAGIGSTGGILSAGIGAIATKAVAGLAAAALVTAGAVEVSQKPAPAKPAAIHHHALVAQTPPPPPPPPAPTSSAGSFKSTVAPVRAKKSHAVKAAATKTTGDAQATKPADKTQGKDGTATTKAAAPTQPPGRKTTETDPTVLPPPAVPTTTTTPAPTATAPPAPTTTTTTSAPTSTTPTTTTPTPTTPTSTTPPSTTTTPPPTTTGPPADGSGTDPGSANGGATGDPAQLNDPTAAPSVDTLTSVTRSHRHRRHALLTW